MRWKLNGWENGESEELEDEEVEGKKERKEGKISETK